MCEHCIKPDLYFNYLSKYPFDKNWRTYILTVLLNSQSVGTQNQLVKLHRNISHPSNEKLLNLLKFAQKWENDSRTKDLLQEISRRCFTYQRFSPAPIPLKVSIPNEEELVFREELSMDLVFLGNKSVLHIIVTGKRFSAATFPGSFAESYGQNVKGIWFAFVMKWCPEYSGYPNRSRTDLELVSTSYK